MGGMNWVSAYLYSNFLEVSKEEEKKNRYNAQDWKREQGKTYLSQWKDICNYFKNKNKNKK